MQFGVIDIVLALQFSDIPPRAANGRTFPLYHFAGFDRVRLLSRTPTSPPFSSVNSTPAASNAPLITARVACRVSVASLSNNRTGATRPGFVR
jgi:hypothetical protein